MEDKPKRRNLFNKAERYKKEKVKARRKYRIKRINIERELAKKYHEQLTSLETISTKYSLKLDDEMLKIDIHKQIPNED